MTHLTENDFMSKPEATLDQVTIAAQKLGYIDCILDLQRILKDDFELDSSLRHAISRAMMTKKGQYLLPQSDNLYDKLWVIQESK